MKLSKPVYRLKRHARQMARLEGTTHSLALDRVALAEGFSSWSLLAAQLATAPMAAHVFPRLVPGTLLLVGARPGQGKTIVSLQIALEAIKAGRDAAFFSLEWTVATALAQARRLCGGRDSAADALAIHDRDAIDASYIRTALGNAAPGTTAVIDYLQLLDQRRDSSPLMAQVSDLRSLARDRGLVLVFSAQISRSYDAGAKAFPDLDDVRLPNPLDLSLFDTACFLNDGRGRFTAIQSAGPRHG